jgi:hypothetical protein
MTHQTGASLAPRVSARAGPRWPRGLITSLWSALMKSFVFKLSALTIATAASLGAHAGVLYGQNVTGNIIYGSGNPNGNFTVDTSAGGLELGLRAKQRSGLVTGDNGNGSYNQAAGISSGTRAKWNFEFSIFTGNDSTALGLFTYKLGIDYNPGVGTSFLEFDPINGLDPRSGVAFFDHSFGNSTTAHNAGVEAVADANALANYAALVSNNSLVQQSWNLDFYDNPINSFDANLDGNYSIFLEAYDSSGSRVARSDITVIVGAGAAVVPEPGSLALAGLALAGLAVVGRRKAG